MFTNVLRGATDNAIPQVNSGGGILTDEDRDALAAHSIRLAPYGDEQYAMEMQNIYAALAQPSERLYVTYPALMTGSGPTVFGIFKSEAAARCAVETLQEKYPQTFLTYPV